MAWRRRMPTAWCWWVRRGVFGGYYDLSANEGIAQLNSHIDLLVNETIDP